MKIQDGPSLAKAEKQERWNLSDYLDELALWTYEYVHSWSKWVFSRLSVSYDGHTWNLEKYTLSPDEIWIVALACKYYKPNFPQNNENAEKEFAEYQYKLQSYLWITNPELVIEFYDELISNIKPEHNNLIPILHTYHTQIHALKIAYDALKSHIHTANLTSRVVFWLVCIELMKLRVRLYLIEPMARTDEWKNLDWICMLDTVFDDFSFESQSNRESMRRKNVIGINRYKELWLESVVKHIQEIRDEVATLKSQKNTSQQIIKEVQRRSRNI